MYLAINQKITCDRYTYYSLPSSLPSLYRPGQPSRQPSVQPSMLPSSQPTTQPTRQVHHRHLHLLFVHHFIMSTICSYFLSFHFFSFPLHWIWPSWNGTFSPLSSRNQLIAYHATIETANNASHRYAWLCDCLFVCLFVSLYVCLFVCLLVC